MALRYFGKDTELAKLCSSYFETIWKQTASHSDFRI